MKNPGCLLETETEFFFEVWAADFDDSLIVNEARARFAPAMFTMISVELADCAA